MSEEMERQYPRPRKDGKGVHVIEEAEAAESKLRAMNEEVQQLRRQLKEFEQLLKEKDARETELRKDLADKTKQTREERELADVTLEDDVKSGKNGERFH